MRKITIRLDNATITREEVDHMYAQLDDCSVSDDEHSVYIELHVGGTNLADDMRHAALDLARLAGCVHVD